MTQADPGTGWQSGGQGADTLGTVMGLLRAVRAHWVVALLVAVPMGAGAVWYTEQLPSSYEAEAIVLVEPRPEAGQASGPSVVRLKAPSYVAYLTAPATVDVLAADLGLERSTVSAALDAEVQSETSNVLVTARSTDPERAARIAAAGAEELVDFSTGDELLQAQVIAPPVTPTSPAGPPRRLIEAAAIVVALGLAALAALVVDRRHPRITGPRDVELATGYPLLGRLPQRRRLPQEPTAAFADPAVGTAMRSLRVRLAGEVHAGSSITVTSSLPGEGKSLVSAMLATAFARTGFTVALVDGDVRRPRVHEFLEHWQGPDLSDVIDGRATLEAALVSGWTDHLRVLPTRTGAQQAGEALTEHVADVLRDLRVRHDIVVVDAPPLLATDEAKVLASATDAVITVVALGTPSEALMEAQALLSGLRSRVLGYVLNRTAHVTGYGGGDYGYGYD